MRQSITKEEKEKKQREKKLKELYTRYNQCRDAELDRFWKNSVFVWVFLALCFTALGVLIFDHNTKYGLCLLRKGLDDDDYYFYSLIVSVCGLVLSNVWVWMARGLKAWYEVFENVIWKMETYDNVFEFPKEYTIDNFWIIKGNTNSVWMRSAPISTSKIVILIGRLLVLLWGIIFLCYFYKYTNPIIWSCNNWNTYKQIYGWKVLWEAFNLKFWVVTIGVPALLIYSKLLIHSSTLKTDAEIEFENSLISNIKANIFDKNMWNGQPEYRYYADVLLSSLEQGVTTKGNKYFKSIIIDTKKQNFYKFNHIYDNPNNTIEITELTHRDTLLNYLNNVLLNHNRLDTKHYIIRIIKPINYPRSTIRYKIKCHICLRYIINEFFEREIFKI